MEAHLPSNLDLHPLGPDVALTSPTVCKTGATAVDKQLMVCVFYKNTNKLENSRHARYKNVIMPLSHLFLLYILAESTHFLPSNLETPSSAPLRYWWPFGCFGTVTLCGADGEEAREDVSELVLFQPRAKYWRYGSAIQVFFFLCLNCSIFCFFCAFFYFRFQMAA